MAAADVEGRDPQAIIPARPQSARASSRGANRQRHTWRSSGHGGWQVETNSMKTVETNDLTQSAAEAPRVRESSVRRHHGADREDHVHVGGAHGYKDGSEALTSLMLAVLNVYESRTSLDLWSKLLEPLRSLVPCEEVKVVVFTRRLPPTEAPCTGPFDPTLRQRMKAVTFVEQWDQRRVEGAAALSRRICRIPSTDAERFRWDQYEVARSQASSFRCLLAMPLFDANGNVLAVVKFLNRVSHPGGQSLFEFQKSDFPTLSAFAAIFAAIVPNPYIGHLGGQTPCRPTARLQLSDEGISAIVTWKLPKELQAGSIQEIAFGEIREDDEHQRLEPPAHWQILPCGLLEPHCGATDGEEPYFEFTIPHLVASMNYGFSVRIRNQHSAAAWSEPSLKLSTYLAPPHALGNHSIALVPLSDSSVRLNWTRLATCDPGLQLVEYRVVACVDGEVQDEQVVGVFMSDGSAEFESTTVAHLYTNTVYRFAIEARYAYVGSRNFNRVLVSEPFSFPTVDLTLPPPQPLAADALPANRQVRPSQVVLRWPYPADVSRQLSLQYRTAWPTGPKGGCPRLSVSTWAQLNTGEFTAAQLIGSGGTEEVRLVERSVFDGHLAVQFRVVALTHGGSSSPPSAWFHPSAPAVAEASRVHIACKEEDGIGLEVRWQSGPESRSDIEAPHRSEQLGPLGYSVHHDFSRGHGRCPTRFQVRYRLTAEDGTPRGDWMDTPPQLMPTAEVRDAVGTAQQGATSEEGCASLRVSQYSWRFQDKALLSQPIGAAEVEMRLGNVLFWSEWHSCGLAALKVAPPMHQAGAHVRLEDVRGDTVRLVWPACLPAEPGLQALEYRVMCLELPEATDVRMEAGGRIITWRTVDTITVEGSSQGDGDASTQSTSTQSYVVRALQPHKRYNFAVECFYARLPVVLATAAAVRLESAKPMPSRSIKLTPALESPKVHLCISEYGLALAVSWQVGLQPRGAAVPSALFYQLARVSEEAPAQTSGEEEAPPSSLKRDELPAGLLHWDHAAAGCTPSTKSTSQGSFRSDATGEVLFMSLKLSAKVLQAALGSLSALRGLRLVTRLGDPTTGSWSEWCSRPSVPIDIVLPPPTPPVQSTEANSAPSLQVHEEFGLPAFSVAMSSSRGLQSVRLAWQPFGHTRSLPQEMQGQLLILYEIVAWCLGESLVSLKETRQALLHGADPPAQTMLAYRSTVDPSSLQRVREGQAAGVLHEAHIPGACLQPLKYHIFQVKAKYGIVNSKEIVMELESERSSLINAVAAVSEAFLPPAPKLAPPVVARCRSDDEVLGGGSVRLGLPAEVAETSSLLPAVIECRVGNQQGDDSSSVVPASDWAALSAESLEAVSGTAASEVVLRGLAAAPCQFRLRQGSTISDPSAWTDTSVWCPEPVGEMEVAAFLCAKPPGSARLGGLAAVVGIGSDASLSARLLWPASPSERPLVPLERYQVRYRRAGNSEWIVRPAADVPVTEVRYRQSGSTDWTVRPLDASSGEVGATALNATCCECIASRELPQGVPHEFSLRLCNALGRWSPWTKATAPLALSLPKLLAGRVRAGSDAGLKIVGATPTAVKLAWKPFRVPRRGEDGSLAMAVIIDEVTEVPGALMAEYELLIKDAQQGATVGILQREGIAFYDESLIRSRVAFLEAEVLLEPDRTYVFEVRARIRRGDTWGPPVKSEPVPPRLASISISRLAAEVFVTPASSKDDPMEAGIAFQCIALGFHGNSVQDTSFERAPLELKGAKLEQYQLRSASIAKDRTSSDDVSWREWPAVDDGSQYVGANNLYRFNVLLHEAAVALNPSEKHLFCLRCADEYGRWTDWSEPSGSIALIAPALLPSKADKLSGQPALRLVPLAARAIRLEWSPFQHNGHGAPPLHSGSHAALQHIAYRVRAFRRRPKAYEWHPVETPLCEFTVERSASSSSSALSHEVTDLDERCEHLFKLSARWADLPASFANSGWAQEVPSAIYYQPRELLIQDAPRAEVSASDARGLEVSLRWFPSYQLRDSRGLPVEESRFQVRHQRVLPPVAQSATAGSPEDTAASTRSTRIVFQDTSSGDDAAWQQEPVLLEELEDKFPHEGMCRIRSLAAGNWYRFAVRIGDEQHWSGWSPPTAPILVAIDAPRPQLGDRMQVAAGRLQWRPFSLASGLERLEYKVSALEWPSSIARPSDTSRRRFRNMGYVASEPESPRHSRKLSTDLKVYWDIEGLQRGMQYRFFVCARYAALPLRSLAPPHGVAGQSASMSGDHPCCWPSEIAEQLLHVDMASWEAILSSVGLWSDVVNAALMPEEVVTGSVK